jgi:hypothetical protein
MASSAKAVVIIRGPGQRFVNLSHLAAVPGGDTIKETDAPFVCAVIQPLGVILDLVSFARKMSQSFFNFHAPASQPGCVGWLHIVLHRSKLLQLTQSSRQEYSKSSASLELLTDRTNQCSTSDKWYITAMVILLAAKKMPYGRLFLNAPVRE